MIKAKNLAERGGWEVCEDRGHFPLHFLNSGQNLLGQRYHYGKILPHLQSYGLYVHRTEATEPYVRHRNEYSKQGL